ncbi:MAG: helix-turn-helix transcriptional regulator [Kiritimatiellae bacterium]|jgi:y4mF family transcriptional regulator|nr:helix-turn-helix transcriptional regulator [Kiritimatiellia bacterium]
MTISEFIRQQRKAHGLTQRGLADRAGVGLRFVREVEAGKPTLRLDKVNALLDLFGHRLEPVPAPRGED